MSNVTPFGNQQPVSPREYPNRHPKELVSDDMQLLNRESIPVMKLNGQLQCAFVIFSSVGTCMFEINPEVGNSPPSALAIVVML